ncbi:sigma-70 family RNA polymerase sigma factor [Chitinophaga sp. MM2321]|uniref:RNA polymerase sigma factor n=1 Tax=Chitinophaga sp. MM2321 TaxID=3137178 RepID=UPI0032D58B84
MLSKANTDHTYISAEKFESISVEGAWTKFKQGDKKAFEFIFKKYNPVLYHIGIKFFYAPDVVEDCIQELFLKLWKDRETLPEVNTVKYYLITSLRRLLLRKLVVLRRQLDKDRIMTAELNDQYTSSHENHMIVTQLLKEKTDKLTLAIEQLPPRQKQAIYLKFYEEKTYEEITSIMSINYQTARKFIYKAIRSLRKNLDIATTPAPPVT